MHCSVFVHSVYRVWSPPVHSMFTECWYCGRQSQLRSCPSGSAWGVWGQPFTPYPSLEECSRGLEAVFGRSSGRPWSTTAEWAPVEHSAWAWPVIYQDSADPMVYQDSADPWTPSGPFGRVGFPYYMIDLRFDLHAVNIHAQSWTCLLLSNMIWTWFHVLEHDFMFSNMESCP